MRILTIGNSFSEDATRYLAQIARTEGENFEVVNICIGGCSLERHYRNMLGDKKDYLLCFNGTFTGFYVTLEEALLSREWDVITIQQVSHDSGLYETYLPYLDEVADYVRAARPEAELVIHQTWAYETDSQHGGFANYDRDQKKMYDCLVSAYTRAAERLNVRIIPVGKVIQTLRATPAFDYANGGASLCRDGFHLSIPEGRYAAGLTWFAALTGKSALTTAYAPEGVSAEVAELIKKTVDSVVFGA